MTGLTESVAVIAIDKHGNESKHLSSYCVFLKGGSHARKHSNT